MKNGFKVIDIEQHCTTPKTVEAFARFYTKSTVFGAAEGQKRGEFNAFGIGEKQLEVMDRTGIDFAQVQSSFPISTGKNSADGMSDIPNLKVLLGHMGEVFPFLKDRMDAAHCQGGGGPAARINAKPQHSPSYYLEKNVWITTSGNYLPAALRCCIDVMPQGRIMMSSDLPFEDPEICVSFITERDFLSSEQKQALLYDNARSLGFGK